ncbi:TPA: GIY-YIG nuclease family protein [Serratia fonticola]
MSNGKQQALQDIAFVNNHKVEMLFYPDAWKKAKNSVCQWVKEPFPPKPRSKIPKLAGVYIFVVEPNIFNLSQANGLFYVGKAKNLYNRVGSYISELSTDFNKTQRPHIWRMLNQWHGNLGYYYTTTMNVAIAEELETEMINAYIPPFNRSFNAEISQVTRAF